MDVTLSEFNEMEGGIASLLGKAPRLVRMPEPDCVHVSDGFVYEDTDLYYVTGCRKCGMQYTVSKLDGLITE